MQSQVHDQAADHPFEGWWNCRECMPISPKHMLREPDLTPHSVLESHVQHLWGEGYFNQFPTQTWSLLKSSQSYSHDSQPSRRGCERWKMTVLDIRGPAKSWHTSHNLLCQFFFTTKECLLWETAVLTEDNNDSSPLLSVVLHIWTYLILTVIVGGRCCYCPNTEMRKVRHNMVKWCVQSHTRNGRVRVWTQEGWCQRLSA